MTLINTFKRASKLIINFPDKIEPKKEKKLHPGLIHIRIKGQYIRLRTAHFPQSRIVDKYWNYTVENSQPGITTEKNFDWCYHKPTTIKHNILDYKIFPKYRISLNTVADRNLFYTLDEFFAKGTINGTKRRNSPINGYYKAPRYNSDWLTRCNPVTLYFMTEPDQQLIEDIKKITQPYHNPISIPKTDKIFIDGQIKGAEWISYAQEPQPEDFVKLMKRAETIDPVLAEGLYYFAKGEGIVIKDEKNKPIYLVDGDKYTQLFRLSAGQHYAAEKYVDNYEFGLKHPKLIISPELLR